MNQNLVNDIFIMKNQLNQLFFLYNNLKQELEECKNNRLKGEPGKE